MYVKAVSVARAGVFYKEQRTRLWGYHFITPSLHHGRGRGHKEGTKALASGVITSSLHHFITPSMPFHPNSLFSGSVASLTSTLALGICGQFESGSAAGPINGPSQWLWGQAEAYTKELTWRHTATGYVIHHAMSVLWANVYEELQSRSQHSASSTLANAAIVATLGYVVDYGVAPRRFRPGFKKHLGPASIFCVYASFGVGFALATWLSSRDASAQVPR